MGVLRNFLRNLRAARVASRGRRLLARGHPAEGALVLEEALGLLGNEEPRDSTVGMWFSERVCLLRDLSLVAAEAGHTEAADRWIAEGRQFWDRVGPGSPSRFPSMREWFAWAEAYQRKRSAPPSSHT